jgi:serine O-acetyltransferase
VIEDGVEIHSGAAVLGAITVGRGAVVHSNSTVLRNVPMAVEVLGMPAKLVERLPLQPARAVAEAQAPSRRSVVPDKATA